jgi:hypothetical protein
VSIALTVSSLQLTEEIYSRYGTRLYPEDFARIRHLCRERVVRYPDD